MTTPSEFNLFQVLELDPGHTGALNNMGYLLERQGRQQEAIADYRRAIEITPDFPQAHFNLGRILVNQANYNEGIQELLKTLDVQDEEVKPAYLYAVGAAYIRAGDRENGLTYISMAKEQAAARHQSKLLESINRDLQALKGNGTPN